MATMREIRRANLCRLLESWPTQKVFAEANGLAAGHVSQMVNGTREVGENVARRIESSRGLPTGWMDTPHDEPSSPTARLVGKIYSAPGVGIDSRIADLLTRASPKSQGALERIAQAAAAGKLTEADLELLEQIAKRFEAK
jgi:hypothetical protein